MGTSIDSSHAALLPRIAEIKAGCAGNGSVLSKQRNAEIGDSWRNLLRRVRS